jgi:hypothetical protein
MTTKDIEETKVSDADIEKGTERLANIISDMMDDIIEKIAVWYEESGHKMTKEDVADCIRLGIWDFDREDGDD